MTIRTRDELEGMSRVGRVVRLALREMKKKVRAGVTTQQLDDVCAGVFEKFGARSALRLGIDAARAGRPINRIGKAVQSEVELREFSVMPALGGHGVGRTIHEEP